LKPADGGMQALVGMQADKMPAPHAPSRPMRADDAAMQTDRLFMTGDGGVMRARTFLPPRPAQPVKALTKPVDEGSSKAAQPAEARTGKDEFVQSVRSKAEAAGLAPVEITLLVAYTAKAAKHYMNISTDLIDLAVEEANQTFRRSGIGHISLKVVHTHLTDYDETGSAHFDHVWRMADKGDGLMEEIPRLRDEKKADITVLIVDDASGCGLATRVGADADEAYAVVHHECAAASYSLAHEVGHIIGARHDRTLDQNTEPHPHGHGYFNGDRWRTIMTYKSGCNNCPRLPVWSNPDVSYKGEPIGTVQANNARVLREGAQRVSQFR
jgi:hypothetical protein